MAEENNLMVSEEFKNGNLARKIYYASDIPGDDIPSLVKNLADLSNDSLTGHGATYVNTTQDGGDIEIDGDKVFYNRPYTPSELELFSQELSRISK